MARPEREYRRLPGYGRKRGSFFAFTATRAALWAGKDHILSVCTTGYTEEYKRFYYRDIQAIVTRKSSRGAVVNFISALFLTFFALLALTRTTPALAVIWWTFAGISLLVLTFNLLRGPTCVCHLQTAVSREELPSLGRERAARKAVGILKPLIEAAQGALQAEEIASRSAELSTQSAPASRPGAAAPSAGASGGYGGNIHEALFYLLLLDGLMSGAQLFVRNVPLSILGALFTVAFSIIVVIALARQHGTGLTPGLRGITWGAFAYMVASWIAGYVVFVYEMVKNPMIMRQGQWEMVKAMSRSSAADNPVLKTVLILSVIFTIPLGLSGFVLLKKFQAGRGAAGAQPLPAGPAQTGQ